jgi:glycosyltransferase involved in cell wall biosynthesis
MNYSYYKRTGPLVTVLIPTYNRPHYLPIAIESVVHQDYENLEIFVMNDGGQDVSNIVESFDDRRIVFVNGRENRGLPFRLNEALSRAQGKYVCYLGDDDLFYRHHVSTLVDVLENKTDCQVAYSDLYKSYCRVNADGSRTVLSKLVEVSRDFDRYFMFYFNHALHVSLMHRRDLLDKAGPYNENLNVLIDWDLTKRLVFYSDFHHIHDITGEFYSQVGESDRISVKRRKDKKEYARNVMAIRTTRPPKPWPKVADVSIIFVSDKFDQQAGNTLGLIWRHTFYPYEVYLPMPREEFAALNTEMPNLVNVLLKRGSSFEQQIDACLAVCQGEYIVIVPRGYEIHEMWMEDPLYALLNSNCDREAMELELSGDELWAAVIRKDLLVRMRRHYPHLSVRESLKRAGINLEQLKPDDISFQFDQLYNEAQDNEKNGNWATAARMYECIANNHKNEVWMKGLAARSFYKAGEFEQALKYSRQVNEERPTVETLLTEAKVCRARNKFESAICLLEQAEGILEGRQLQWT